MIEKMEQFRTRRMERARQQPDSGRILPFARPGDTASRWRRRGTVPSVGPSPVDDVAKYERPAGDADDYRHRQIVNVAAFVVLALLVLAGVWIADRMASMQRDQECVLAGRRNLRSRQSQS